MNILCDCGAVHHIPDEEIQGYIDEGALEVGGPCSNCNRYYSVEIWNLPARLAYITIRNRLKWTILRLSRLSFF